MSDGGPVVYSVKEWMELIEKGEVQIPDFQREFVWDRKKVVKLIEAILKERPVGSLLCLNVRTTKGGKVPFHPRPINTDLPEGTECKILILDGQQRLTGLWHALRDKSSNDSYFLEYRDDDEDDSVAGHAAAKPTNGRTTWVNNEKKCIEKGFVPMHLFLEDPLKVREWIDKAHENEEGLVPGDKTRELQNWIAGIGDQILSFKIPYLPLPNKTSDSEAIEAFIESNTSSQPLRKFDLTVATMHLEKGEDLRDLRDETIDKVNDVMRYVDGDELGDMIIKVACLRKNLSPTESNYRRDDVLNEIIANIEEIRSGIKWACDILKRNYILTSKYLPSRVPLRVLPALYGALPSDEKEKDICEKLTRKYLWRAFFTSRYTSDAAHLLLSDYRGLRDSFGKKENGIQIDILDDETYPLPTVEEIENATGWPKNQGALPRAILTMSFIKGARDLRNNIGIDHINIDERDAHHIFPKKYLKEKAGIEDKSNIALNCMLIASTTNKRASSKPPTQYLNDLYSGKDARALIEEPDIRSRLKSHLIPAEVLLREDIENVEEHYKEFIHERAKLMMPIIDKLANGEDPD